MEFFTIKNKQKKRPEAKELKKRTKKGLHLDGIFFLNYQNFV